MRTPSVTALIGGLLGLVWALGGLDAVLLVVVLAAVGWVVGAVMDDRIDLTRYLGHRHDRR